MSNPGVIILSKLEYSMPRKIILRLLNRARRFQVEDNIGEAIHVHLDDFRVDLTTAEFESISSQIEGILRSYLVEKDPLLGNLDMRFVSSIASHLPFIDSVGIVEKPLKKLSVIEYTNIRYGIYKIKPIELSLAAAYLSGASNKFLNYRQHGSTLGNQKRLTSLSSSIHNNGYPFGGEYVVLFGTEHH